MSGGSNSSGGGKSGVTVSKTLVTQQGKTIDIGNTPMTYGPVPKDVDKGTWQTVKDFYDKRKEGKIEYGLAIGPDGKPLYETKGSKGSVPLYRPNGYEATVHNHPRAGKQEEYDIGGTFSKGDAHCIQYYKDEKASFVVASEGIYWLKKGPQFDADGFYQFAVDSDKKNRKVYNQKWKEVNGRYKNKEISFDETVRQCGVLFAEYMVANHNDYLAGQKVYGYTYGIVKHD